MNHGRKADLVLRKRNLLMLTAELMEYRSSPTNAKLEEIECHISEYASILLDQRDFSNWVMHIQEGTFRVKGKWVKKDA